MLAIVARLHEVDDVVGACPGRQPKAVEVVQVGAEAFGAAGFALRTFNQLRIDPLQSALDRDAWISLAHSLPERLGVTPAASALSAARSDSRNERCALTQFDDDADSAWGLAGRVLWRVRHTSAPSRCVCVRAGRVTAAPRVRDREMTPSRRGFAKMRVRVLVPGQAHHARSGITTGTERKRTALPMDRERGALLFLAEPSRGSACIESSKFPDKNP